MTVVGGTDAPGPEVFDDSPAAQAVRLRAHAAWDELVDMMVDHRFPVDPAETPRAVVDRLTRTASLTGPAAEGAQLLGTAEERARYARQPLTAADVGPALARVRKAVQRRVSTRTRLVASLMPPSTTARMRVGAVNLYTGLSTRIADVRDGVLKLVNPRQLLAGRGAR